MPVFHDCPTGYLPPTDKLDVTFDCLDKQSGQLQIIFILLGIGRLMTELVNNLKIDYKPGDKVFNHAIAAMVTIDNITLSPQRQPMFGYKTANGTTGIASTCDLGEQPGQDLDVNTDAVLINQCSIAEILAAFPSLPGGKGVMARKIIVERNESPFENELAFINRMTEIAPRCDWEQISHKLKYELADAIGV